ncbi:MAG: ATP-binding protein [Deltaproteobacteria bacterium]|nr:MAG: ATP-binding protein [Deltaproteobacteria bacterium]
MNDYEKLGAFYLGRDYDLATRKLKDRLVLYDSKDLTTHGVIIGMTGSGKTGLGIALIEEALIDGVPVIAVDPKGDLPNLLLSFPELRAEDFRSWVNEQDAMLKGLTLGEYAAKQAKTWRKGLAEWGQEPERIARLRASADFAVYTPGSNAGLPVSVLRTFAPPPGTILNDSDLLRERIQTTTTSLLALIGIEADPLTSPEHILIANILNSTWSSGKGLDLAGLIHAIQSPPFERLGVMDLDSFFPAKERFGLAMRLNSLLAAPGFESWLSGEPLDINRMLFTGQGKPRLSVFTINHLSDGERMFFVSILLNEILGWIRMQPGTSSLRAILYIDEIFGYFPPVKNPPSKAPLLTLLKQARAFGLGVVLSTQNPVDIDYKGLANAGTWLIGRLQTDQDKERVLGGLEGAAAGTGFDRGQAAEILSRLGQRVFLLHNVHENEPAIFQSRWVLSYLRGPMTREQIKVLMAARKEEESVFTPPLPGGQHAAARAASRVTEADTLPTVTSQPPMLPSGIDVFYLAASGAGQGLIYYPAVIGQVDVFYSNVSHDVDTMKTMAFAVEFEEGPVALDWDKAVEFGLADLQSTPVPGAEFAELPVAAHDSKAYRNWNRDLLRWVRLNRPLTLYRSKRFNQTSRVHETEGEFRARLAQGAREKRDLAIEKLRRKYSSKFTTLNNRLMRAEQSVSREEEQAKSKTMATAISFGTAILGAFLGRKTISATSASRMGTAMKSAGRMRKEKMDVARARQTAEAIRNEMNELEMQLQADIQSLEGAYDPASEELKEINLKPKSTNMSLRIFGLAWMPYRKDRGGRLSPDWS